MIHVEHRLSPDEQRTLLVQPGKARPRAPRQRRRARRADFRQVGTHTETRGPQPATPDDLRRPLHRAAQGGCTPKAAAPGCRRGSRSTAGRHLRLRLRARRRSGVDGPAAVGRLAGGARRVPAGRRAHPRLVAAARAAAAGRGVPARRRRRPGRRAAAADRHRGAARAAVPRAGSRRARRRRRALPHRRHLDLVRVGAAAAGARTALPPEPDLVAHIRRHHFQPPYVEPLVRRTAEADLLGKPRPKPGRADVKKTGGDVVAELETTPDPKLGDEELLIVLVQRLGEHGVWPEAYRVGERADGTWCLNYTARRLGSRRSRRRETSRAEVLRPARGRRAAAARARCCCTPRG